MNDIPDMDEAFGGTLEDFSFETSVPTLPSSLQAPKYMLQVSAPKRKIESFMDVYDSNEKMEFVYHDIMPDTGLLYFGGESASGKTILAIQAMVNIVLRRNTLNWVFNKDVRNQKILFLSLEMNRRELRDRIRSMYPMLDDDQRKLIQESIDVYCDFEPFQLWNTLHGTELHHIIQTGEYTGCVIDSASLSFGESMTNTEQINKSIAILQRMRAATCCWNIVVAHTKKPQGDEKKRDAGDVSMHDIMGHSGFAQSASSIIILDRDKKKTTKDHQTFQVVNAKNRFGLEGSDHIFTALLPSKDRTKNDGIPLQFMTNIPIPLPPLTVEARKNLKNKALDLNDSISQIDFSFMEDDE